MAICELALVALTLNIWHESRGEPLAGQIAVGEVTINRVISKHYPNDVTSVVTQRKQFSWTINKRLQDPMNLIDHANAVLATIDTPKEVKAWRQAEWIARGMLTKGYKPRHRFTMFHTTDIKPYWSQGRKGTVIGSHKFYL